MCIQIGNKKVGQKFAYVSGILYLCIVIERGFNHKGMSDIIEYSLRPTPMGNC